MDEDDISRKSKDKVKNREGEDLIMRIRNMGIHIVNGDTDMDREGEWTYIGAGGKSMIDYLVTNTEGREIIEDMKVGNSEDSYHQPIETILKLKAEENEKDSGIGTYWSETGIKKYVGNLAERDEARTWIELKEKIRKSMVTKNHNPGNKAK